MSTTLSCQKQFSITTKEAPCLHVDSLALERITPYRLRLTWHQDNTSGGLPSVYRSTDGVNYTNLGFAAVTALGAGNYKYEVPNAAPSYLTPNTTYYYAVRAAVCTTNSLPITVQSWPDPVLADPTSLGDCVTDCSVGGGFGPLWDGNLYWLGHQAGYQSQLDTNGAVVTGARYSLLASALNVPVGGMFLSGWDGIAQQTFSLRSRPVGVNTFWELWISCTDPTVSVFTEYAKMQYTKPLPILSSPVGVYTAASGPCAGVAPSITFA